MVSKALYCRQWAKPTGNSALMHFLFPSGSIHEGVLIISKIYTHVEANKPGYPASTHPLAQGWARADLTSEHWANPTQSWARVVKGWHTLPEFPQLSPGLGQPWPKCVYPVCVPNCHQGWANLGPNVYSQSVFTCVPITSKGLDCKREMS